MKNQTTPGLKEFKWWYWKKQKNKSFLAGTVPVYFLKASHKIRDIESPYYYNFIS